MKPLSLLFVFLLFAYVVCSGLGSVAGGSIQERKNQLEEVMR